MHISLLWSEEYLGRAWFYKHLAPLGRKRIPLLHLRLELELQLSSAPSTPGVDRRVHALLGSFTNC
jgi:hypothetical protein